MVNVVCPICLCTSKGLRPLAGREELADRQIPHYNENTIHEVNRVADQEQLQLLRQDIEDWNTWREQHPEIHPDLRGANLRYADLNYADLNYADLRGTDLSYANLSDANLSDADLSQAYLVVSRFFQANLNSADLSRTDLRGADLSYAKIGFTIFGDDDLRTVKGLETVEHDGPSTIGTDTLVRSQGNIPESFL